VVGELVFSFQFSVFSVQFSVFSVQCSVFSFQFSVFSFQFSVSLGGSLALDLSVTDNGDSFQLSVPCHFVVT
jgi:hypothetical protein